MTYFDPQSLALNTQNRFSALAERTQGLWQNVSLKLIIQSAAFVGIFSYLTLKLSAIGWGNIFQSLPSSPIFYMLSVVFVLLPILTEKITFRLAAQTKHVPNLKVFTRKHVINKAIMNYAGEGYFIHQISRLKGQSVKSAAVIVKDLALLRTFAANFWIIFLTLIAVSFGQIDIFIKIIAVSPTLAVAISLSCLLACLGGIVFFRRLTRLKFTLAGKISALYFGRSLLAACILMAQWSLALPGTPLSVWGLFLIIFFVSKKSPVGGDLVFVSVALLLPGLNADSASIAAMLVMTAAFLQIIYVLGFVTTSDIFKPNRNSLRSLKLSVST